MPAQTIPIQISLARLNAKLKTSPVAPPAAVKAFALAAVVVLSPNPAHFGDLVTAKVSGAQTPSFVPFAVREHHGSTYVLQCLDPVCVPGPDARTVRIGNTRAVILPRTTAADVAHPLRSFQRQTDLPPRQ